MAAAFLLNFSTSAESRGNGNNPRGGRLPFRPPACGRNDRRTNETESPTFKVLAERIGFDRSRGNLPHDLPPVTLWLSVNETPAIGVEAFKLILDFEKRACAAHGSLDLHAVANDLRI